MFSKYSISGDNIKSIKSQRGTSSFLSQGRHGSIRQQQRNQPPPLYPTLDQSHQTSFNDEYINQTLPNISLEQSNAEILNALQESTPTQANMPQISEAHYQSNSSSTINILNRCNSARSASKIEYSRKPSKIFPRSSSFLSTSCPKCIEKNAIFIEVQEKIRKATEQLEPYKPTHFVLKQREREKEMMLRLQRRKQSMSAMNQGLIHNATMLLDLVEGVTPKLYREKHFKASFDRRKDDIVLNKQEWNSISSGILRYREMIYQLYEFQQKFAGYYENELGNESQPEDVIHFVKESQNKLAGFQNSPGSDATTNSSKTSSQRLNQPQLPILEQSESPSKTSSQSVNSSEKRDKIDESQTLSKVKGNRSTQLMSLSDESWKSAHEDVFKNQAPQRKEDDEFKLPELNQDCSEDCSTSRKFQESPKLQPKKKFQTEISQELDLNSAEKSLRKKCELSIGFKQLLAGAKSETPKNQKEFNLAKFMKEDDKIVVSNDSQIVYLNQSQLPGLDTPEFRSLYSYNSPASHNSPIRVIDSNQIRDLQHGDFHFSLKKIVPEAGAVQECLSDKENKMMLMNEEEEFFSLDCSEPHSEGIRYSKNKGVKGEKVVSDFSSRCDDDDDDDKQRMIDFRL